MPGAGDPYLSLVVTARNDDHGGNLLGRMQAFVNGWIAQARRFGIPSELIVVEWNPPPDRPKLSEVLQWPREFGPCWVRFIEVPPELHAKFEHASSLPLYQMIAKNVGIRRARGRFVLVTNIDILFSSELASFLAKQELRCGRMYRIDRYDAMSDVPVNAPVEEQLAYCRSHLIRINVREGTYNVSPEGRPVLMPGDIAAADSGLLFGQGWLPMERYTKQEPFRWAGQDAALLLENPPAGASALVVELEPGPGTGNAALDLEVISESHEVLAHVTVDRRSRLRLPLKSPLPARIWFHVHGGGLPTDRDPRIMNFRAFRFDWERSALGGSASLTPLGRRNILAAGWFAMQHLIDRLAKGGRLVRLTVPVSPRLRRHLKSYVEWRGFVGMAKNVVPYFRRRASFEREAAPGEDIFPGDAGLSPGAGWKALDDYRGESFRVAGAGAEVIVAAGAPVAGELGLQVESQNPVEIRLVDSSGQDFGRQRVDGLTFVQFSVPSTGGRTQIVRLELSEDIKVYWCGWTRSRKTESHTALTQPWGAGWRWDPRAGAMAAANQAELVVRAPDRAGQPLFIDLACETPLDFEIRNTGGAALAKFSANGRAVHRLELALEPGKTHVLNIAAAGSFHAYGCDWTETPGSNAPGFVHTNACGDFTLMARDHWFDLRGYPEFDMFSMNLDSMLCVAAHHGGAREEMLEDPMRIYHIEHGSGSGWTPEGQAKLFDRIAALGLSFVDNEDVLVWAAQMAKLNAPMIFNHENWGMAGVELRETVLPQ